MPLAGGANEIAVVAPDGREVERFSSAAETARTARRPFDTPSSAKFLGTRLMVPNQSFTGDATKQTLLDVETGEQGLPELIPGLDRRRAAALARVAVAQAGPRRITRAPARALPGESRRPPVTVRVERRAGRRWSNVRSFTRRRSGAGRATAFRAAACGPATTAWWCAAQDRARNRSRRVSRAFRVTR